MGQTKSVQTKVQGDATSDSMRIIKMKVLNNDLYNAKLGNDLELLNKFAQVLSSEERLLDTYLTREWMKTVQLYEAVEDGVKEKKRLFSLASESAASTQDQFNILSREEEELSLDELTNSKNTNFNMNENTIKIKLVVTELAQTRMMRGIRRLVSPVMSTFDLSSELDAALIIGPWYVEYNKSNLCVPRKCISGCALFATDLETFETQQDIDRVIKTLAKVIVDWNINKTYKSTGGDKKKEGNCQDFVDDILCQLGVKKDFKGPVKEFMTSLRQKGTCEMIFKVDEEFSTKFNIPQKTKFKSHVQLDQFTKKILEIEPHFEMKYKDYWFLLKSYDRAFWLKHYKFPSDDRFKAITEEFSDDELCNEEITQEEKEMESECDCPFQDPKRTMSVRMMGDVAL
ncbi:hypothetical protein AKO1_014559 [Acrasis kona]|uniref:Uncharacterized protein n=1 Tax=Acrasis kona TaxID=1008807 RepID=A0AAW2Z133_9EUKA